MGEVTNLKTWKERLQDEAIGMAEQFEYAFNKRMAAARKQIPGTNNKEGLELQVNIFFESVIATTVALLGKNINISEEFEEVYVKCVREKFSALRKLHIENKGPI